MRFLILVLILSTVAFLRYYTDICLLQRVQLPPSIYHPRAYLSKSKTRAFAPPEFPWISPYAKIGIIGAGPVGLWLALNLYHHRPDLRISIFERKPQYTRKQHVYVDWTGWKPPKCSPVLSVYKAAYKACNGKRFLPLQELECAFLKQVQECSGIRVYPSHEVQPDLYLEKKCANTDLIFACDGAHSKFRTTFCKEYIFNTNLGNAVVASYHVPDSNENEKNVSQTRALGTQPSNLLSFPTCSSVCLQTSYPGFQLVHNNPSNGKWITTTIHTPSEFKSKTPSWEDLSENEQYAFRAWMEARNQIFHEPRPSLDLLQIHAYELRCYSVKTPVVGFNTKQIILVGDSAMGVPYFRSLRNGLVQVKQLASSKTLEEYDQWFSCFGQKELLRAQRISKSISAGRKVILKSQHMIRHVRLCVDRLIQR